MAAKLEELRVGAVSHGVEWLRSALSEILSGELRALAAAGGVETRSSKNWLPVAQLRDALVKVEGGWVRQKWVLIKLVFLIEVECSSHGAIL